MDNCRRLSGEKITGITIILGIALTVVSSLNQGVDGILTLCGIFGDGCSETAAYSLFNIPISVWGIWYYAMLGLLYLFKRPWVFFGVIAGSGVELALLKIMLEMKFLCFVCMINFLIILTLFICIFNRNRITKTVTICFIFFIISEVLISGSQRKIPGSFLTSDSLLVYARVGGHDITKADVESPFTTQLYKLQKKIYLIEKRSLDDRINEVILEREAVEKGITV